MSKSIVVEKKPPQLEETEKLDSYIMDTVRVRPEYADSVPRRYTKGLTPMNEARSDVRSNPSFKSPTVTKQAWPSIPDEIGESDMITG